MSHGFYGFLLCDKCTCRSSTFQPLHNLTLGDLTIDSRTWWYSNIVRVKTGVGTPVTWQINSAFCPLSSMVQYLRSMPFRTQRSLFHVSFIACLIFSNSCFVRWLAGRGLQQHVEHQVTQSPSAWDVEAVPQWGMWRPSLSGGCRGCASVGDVEALHQWGMLRPCISGGC